MSISLNANFELLSAGLYLDARQQFNTIIEMKDFAETSTPDGFITYNKETQKHYVFNSSNTVDETLGKWREYNNGNSSSTTYATWNSNVDYKVGDIVLKDNIKRQCIVDHTSADFDVEKDNWIYVFEQYYYVSQAQYNQMITNGIITDETKDLYIIDGNTNGNDNENAGIEIYEDYSQFPMDFEFDCVVYAKNEYLDNGVTYNNGFYFANATTGTYTRLSTSSEKQIKDWVSGSSYLEGDYIYHEGELYRCLVTNDNVDFDETNWEQLTYGIDELSKEDVEGLLGLTKEEIEAMTDLILDTEVRLDKTYSSSKIYTDIQQCLEDSKTYTLEELGKFSGVSYKIVASTSEMTSKSIIYLLANGNTYDMYVVEENGVTTKIGNMDVNLDNYFTKAEIEADYLKKVDADGKYATITTMDSKVVKKTDITTTIGSTSVDTQVPSAKTIYDEFIVNKIKDYYVNINSSTALSKYGIDDITTLTGLLSLTSKLESNIRFTMQINDAFKRTLCDCGVIPVNVGGLLVISQQSRGKAIYTTDFGETYVNVTSNVKNTEWGKWQKLHTTTVGDVGVTTITPTNSTIIGTIEYTVKNGICYVSLINVKSTTNNNGLSISTTMPKPAINARCPIAKQTTGSGHIGVVYINKNTTELMAYIYVSNVTGDCIFSYPVAE